MEDLELSVTEGGEEDVQLKRTTGSTFIIIMMGLLQVVDEAEAGEVVEEAEEGEVVEEAEAGEVVEGKIVAAEEVQTEVDPITSTKTARISNAATRRINMD